MIRLIPRIATIGCLILVLVACGTDTGLQTLIADHDTAATEISLARLTATVEYARMQTTLEYTGTQVGIARNQRSSLQSTLVARGTASEYIMTQLPPVGSLSLPTSTPPPTNIVPNSSVPVSPGAGANEGAPIVTPGSATGSEPEITQSGGLELTNIVLARGVQDNGCAVESVSSFTPDDTEIYVVTTARNVQPGITISTRWQDPSGQEVANYSYTTQQANVQECIWFYIDQTDAAFTPGRWSITYEVNGTPFTQPIPFAIVENSN